MRTGSTASAVIASWVLSRYWALAQCSHRSASPVPTQAVQSLIRPDLASIDALRVHCNEVELDGASSCLNALKDDGSVEGTSVSNLEGPLDARDNNSLVSMMETRFSPTDESSLVLYHNILRETTNGLVKPSFNYSQTHTSLRSLAITNIIVGSLLPDLKTRRKFMRRLDKVIEKAAPKSKPQERTELNSVLKVLKHFSGVSLQQLRGDHGFMMMTQHLVFSVREGKYGGFLGLFEALASESIFTIAHSILHTGVSLGFSFKPMLHSGLHLVQGCLKIAMTIQSIAGPALFLPGGVVGTILQYFLRALNLIFFPPLLAITGGLAGAMGVACLLGIPPLFEQLYNFAKTKVLKGVRAVFKHAQLFRLRNDHHGASLLKSSFSSRYLAMLTKLWQLDSVGVEALDATVSQTTFSSEVFSNGFMNGVIDFAKEYSSLVEEDYLPGYEEETTKCYEQDKLLAKTKVVCEGAFRRVEVFLARSTEVLNFISWMSLRDHITELLLMVYNTAKVSLEAQTRQGGHVTIETLRAKFGKDSLKQSLAQNILIKPRMQRDVHNITAGVAGIVAFFQLRKLHQWKPRPVDRTRRANESATGTASEQTSTEGKPEDLSLVGQRLEAFTDVDMPPELERAAPEFKNANDTTVTSTEATLLETYSKKRDMLMMSLLRKSVGKLVKAFSSIFGRLQKMFRATVGRGRVHLCRRSDRQPCFNADEATKSRFAVLQFILAAHLGVHVGPNEKLGESPQELKKDFMTFFKDSAWFRYRTRTLKVFQRRTRWGLDILIDYIFPEQKGQGKKGNPISKEALSLIEQAALQSKLACVENVRMFPVTSNQMAADTVIRKLFRLTRLQCIKMGTLLVMTTDMGKAKIFRPEPALAPDVRQKLCTPEHEFVKFTAWYTQKDVGGKLKVPGLADIDGYIVDSTVVLKAKHEDENAALLIEAALWSKGIPRVDALMAADILVATKRMLYGEESWEAFLNNTTPTELDFVQQSLSNGMQMDSTKFDVESGKALYSFDLSAEGLLELLVRSLESTVITAGSLNAGLSDLALIVPATLGLEALKLAEKNVTGLTSMLSKFQLILWDEYASRKQATTERPVSSHLETSGYSNTSGQPAGSDKTSISQAFSREEGTKGAYFEDLCEELHMRASTSPDEKGLAKLTAHDAGVIQCSLLRFLGKRHMGAPSPKEKEAAFRYLHEVTQLLRRAKKSNRYSWKTYLNAKPRRRGDSRAQAASVQAAIRRSLATLKKQITQGAGRVAHKIRSAAAKRVFGVRALNILRGPEFLRTLHLAAVETFADQALFPSKMLIHPTTLAAFTRLRTITKFEVLPIMGRIEGTEVVTQMKMMPTPSPSMKKLIKQLRIQLENDRIKLGIDFKRHVRQCAGFLSLLHITSAAPAFVGSHLSHLFSRFALLLDRSTPGDKGNYFITERNLAYLEPASMKLVLKVGDALTLFEKSAMVPPTELHLHRTLGLLSNVSPASLPLAAAGGKLHRPRLSHASMFLFCNLAIPVLDHPNHQRRREAGVKQLEELRQLLITSKLPLYFQANKETTSRAFEFHNLESLIRAAQQVKIYSETARQPEVTAGFLLHAPLMKALEIMGLGPEAVGDDFIASPLQCTPEDRSSGTSYTIPINGSSRLRMITSILLQIGDAEDVLNSLNVATVSTGRGDTEASLKVKTVSRAQSIRYPANEGSPLDVAGKNFRKSEVSGSDLSKRTEEYKQISALEVKPQRGFHDESTLLATKATDTLKPPAMSPSTKESRDSGNPRESDAVEAEKKYIGGYSVKMAIKAQKESLENAKATVAHLKEQAILFEAHCSTFVSTFHTLLSIAQLPSRLYSEISTRFVDELATVILGGSRKKQRRFVHHVGLLLRRKRQNRRVGSGTNAKVSVGSAASRTDKSNAPFFTAFLPSSMKAALDGTRKRWKGLLATDYLAVRSAACKQDADLWLKDEIETNAQSPETAAESLMTDSTVLPPQLQASHRGRQELCVHPLWLELRSRITVEQDALETEQLFSYFFRMGVDNVTLIQRTVDQVLLDQLWNKLVSMGVLGVTASPEASTTARERMHNVVAAVSKKSPLMAVQPVRDLVSTLLEKLLQTPSMTKNELREMLKQLQIDAVERAAAFLLSRTAGIEQDAAEEAVGNLLSSQTSDIVAADFSPGEEPLTSNLQEWLVQMYFVADSLLLLSRPSVFNPAVVLLEILNKITTGSTEMCLSQDHQTSDPKSRVYSMWRKAFKTTRQLAISSLELLLRLPRAYVRYYHERSAGKTVKE